MRKWLLLGLAAVLLIGIAAYFHVSSPPAIVAVKPVTEATPSVPASEPISAAKAPTISPPSFDIVRVEPTGEMVIGGRGEPGASMTLMSDGKPYDSVKVGANGQFAMVPKPLSPGPHNLTLSMKTINGQTLLSTQNVAVDVPDSKKGPLLVAKTEAGKPTQLLTPNVTAEAQQGTTPQAATAPATPESQPAKTPELATGRAIVAITVVEAEDTGTLYVAGKASAGATVRLYLNDTYLATAEVGPDAAWSLKIAKGVVPGQYKIRIDDVDPANGKVLSRAEVNFDFATKLAETAAAQAAPASQQGDVNQAATAEVKTPTPAPSASVVVDSIETATVTRGDSLWRISRKTYGSGYRYTVIHQANQEQIRDPDLIYPGQIFVLPKLN